MANASIYNAFERFWGHTSDKIADVNVHADETMDAKLKSAKSYVDGVYDASEDALYATELVATKDENNDFRSSFLAIAENVSYSFDSDGNVDGSAYFNDMCKISHAIPTVDELKNGGIFSISTSLEDLNSYTFTFTGDENHIRTKEYGIGIVDIENNAICLVVVPESSVGMKYESEEGYDIFPEAGIYTSIFSVALLLQAANPEIDSSNFAIDDFTISLSISDYKTLKPEHLTEHNHSDLYHTKDVTNAKVSGVKSYVDGMYDITKGDTLNMGMSPTYGELKFVGEHTNGVDIIPTDTTTAISNNVITADKFANWSISIFSITNPNIEPVVIAPSVIVNDSLFSLSGGTITEHTISDTIIEDATYAGLLKVSDIFYVIPEEAVGVNLAGSPVFPEISSDWDGEYIVTEVTASNTGLYCFNLIWYLMAYIQGNGITEADGVGCTLTINGYDGFTTSKTLKYEHIPDTIATKEYVDAAISAAIG